ncbi:hypothetical protein HY224_00220 [Candidatus Uhrbacteria bacterium]|nr:hypothetical protein [Candidatus Uhrbacteria bacterium]
MEQMPKSKSVRDQAEKPHSRFKRWISGAIIAGSSIVGAEDRVKAQDVTPEKPRQEKSEDQQKIKESLLILSWFKGVNFKNLIATDLTKVSKTKLNPEFVEWLFQNHKKAPEAILEDKQKIIEGECSAVLTLMESLFKSQTKKEPYVVEPIQADLAKGLVDAEIELRGGRPKWERVYNLEEIKSFSWVGGINPDDMYLNRFSPQAIDLISNDKDLQEKATKILSKTGEDFGDDMSNFVQFRLEPYIKTRGIISEKMTRKSAEEYLKKGPSAKQK